MADPVEPFTHLEVHSHYSLLEGTAGVSELAGRAASEGMTHLALTDSNALYGAVAFNRACQAVGIQPIVGVTLNVAALPEEMAHSAARAGRLVLLATGPEGYGSLCRLSSLIQGSPDRETLVRQGLNWDALNAHRKGLLCLSAGRSGWVERHVRAGDYHAAYRYAARLAGTYGENAFLSLELHRREDGPVLSEIAGLGDRLGIPIVAVQPVYCLSTQDVPRLRLLAAIKHNCTLGAVPPWALPAAGEREIDLHWLGTDEVTARFAAYPQAVAAASAVAYRCKQALPDGKPIWPVLKLPEGKTEEAALANLAQAGLDKRYGPNPGTAVRMRLVRELDAIAQHGYAPLFLLVADIVQYARDTQVPVSTRGSVANSLVAYCTGITTVDPVAHDLLFERFLSPARSDPPDIDVDLCSHRRAEVLEYVRNTYGADRVALVATISTMRPRSALRETAKASGLDRAEIQRLIAGLPRGWLSNRRPDRSVTLDDVLLDLHDPLWREIVRSAANIVGQPHHLSLHPGGVVITPGPLTDVVPVQWTPKGFLATQFDHQDTEALGLPKIDLLGVRALTVLAETAELVQRHYDPDFLLADIPVPSTVSARQGASALTLREDSRTGDMLSSGDSIGVFQCESAGARRTLRQLRARTVRDLAVANALFKPGPARGGMAETFVRRYRGDEPVTFLHPALEEILAPTKGVLLFQEQILRVAREIAGLSWADADRLRRGVKFQPVEMAQVRERFLEGCRRTVTGPGDLRDGPGFTAEQAETLWDQVIAFAGYGFNQGHATAYADVSYRSAYMKAHWPTAFFCARLANRGGFHHPAIYVAEAIRLGITVHPPHVNHSCREFTLSDAADDASKARAETTPTLWMGLGQVRDLRRTSIDAIVHERELRPFTDVRDLLTRVALQPKETMHLIQCGALDALGANRAVMLAEAQDTQRAQSAMQMAFEFARPQVQPESPAQRVAWEMHLLGQPISVHPLALVEDQLPTRTRLRNLPKRSGRRVTVAGVRLPGWTGDRSYFLGDGDTFVSARGSAAPPAWHPMLVRGRWLSDDWGTFWLRVEQIKRMPVEGGEAGRSASTI